MDGVATAAAAAEVDYEFLPFFRAYKDGSIQRLIPDEFVPPSPDPQSSPVTSKDITIDPETGLSCRLFLPSSHLLSAGAARKLPLLLYFHGGGFLIGTPFDPTYNSYLINQVKQADVIALSVHYRRAPEHPLPTAYMDCWAAIHWAASHKSGSGPDLWLNRFADFGRVFLAGDSAGANIAHNLAMAAGDEDLGLDLYGLVLIHPYFWGSTPIGVEADNPNREILEKMWPVVCPSAMPDPGQDDPRLNPVAEGAPSLARLGCWRAVVFVAENDALRDRGRLYFEALGRSGWLGVVEIKEEEGEDHVFYLMDLEGEKAKRLVKDLANFINCGLPPPMLC